MRYFKIFLLGFLTFQLLALYSQKAYGPEDMAFVRGKVIDSETGAAVGATLVYELEPYATGIGFCQSNAETGDYELRFLKGSTYKVVVSANDYIKLTTRIETTEDLQKDIMLTPVIKEVFTLDNLIFQRGQAVIDERSFADLDKLVTLLKDKSELKIQLEGHTDFAGNAGANMELSQERVEAVKTYLAKKGVKKKRIKLKAFGGSQPLSRERTDEARTANRRVEVRILNPDS